MAYSYWKEYQNALKDNKELEEKILAQEEEICSLKILIEQLKCQCGAGQTPIITKPTNQDEIIRQLESKVNLLEEQLFKEKQKYDGLKVEVHTRVIEAINKSFN